MTEVPVREHPPHVVHNHPGGRWRGRGGEGTALGRVGFVPKVTRDICDMTRPIHTLATMSEGTSGSFEIQPGQILKLLRRGFPTYISLFWGGSPCTPFVNPPPICAYCVNPSAQFAQPRHEQRHSCNGELWLGQNSHSLSPSVNKGFKGSGLAGICNSKSQEEKHMCVYTQNHVPHSKGHKKCLRFLPDRVSLNVNEKN